MASFYEIERPIIENGKLVIASNGGCRSFIGIQVARQQLRDLENKTNLRPSSIERRELLRKAVALWDAQ